MWCNYTHRKVQTSRLANPWVESWGYDHTCPYADGRDDTKQVVTHKLPLFPAGIEFNIVWVKLESTKTPNRWKPEMTNDIPFLTEAFPWICDLAIRHQKNWAINHFSGALQHLIDACKWLVSCPLLQREDALLGIEVTFLWQAFCLFLSMTTGGHHWQSDEATWNPTLEVRPYENYCSDETIRAISGVLSNFTPQERNMMWWIVSRV